jgi:hypothetical protein
MRGATALIQSADAQLPTQLKHVSVVPYLVAFPHRRSSFAKPSAVSHGGHFTVCRLSSVSITTAQSLTILVNKTAKTPLREPYWLPTGTQRSQQIGEPLGCKDRKFSSGSNGGLGGFPYATILALEESFGSGVRGGELCWGYTGNRGYLKASCRLLALVTGRTYLKGRTSAFGALQAPATNLLLAFVERWGGLTSPPQFALLPFSTVLCLDTR